MTDHRGMIKNPESGRWVKRSGAIGKAILSAKKGAPKKKVVMKVAKKNPCGRGMYLTKTGKCMKKQHAHQGPCKEFQVRDKRGICRNSKKKASTSSVMTWFPTDKGPLVSAPTMKYDEPEDFEYPWDQ